MPNGSDSDQVWRSVGTDLGPNCLQKISTNEKSRRYQGKGSSITSMCFGQLVQNVAALMIFAKLK